MNVRVPSRLPKVLALNRYLRLRAPIRSLLKQFREHAFERKMAKESQMIPTIIAVVVALEKYQSLAGIAKNARVSALNPTTVT
jgi:hypothetical protein